MKPIVIITIAVVCSVAAVLGVLVGMSEIRNIQHNEYPQQVQIQQKSIELLK